MNKIIIREERKEDYRATDLMTMRAFWKLLRETNALVGKNITDTKAVREDDSKGRHTTTYRQMFVLESGVTIIDTPGMREIGISDTTKGLEETFDDIIQLSKNCKFSNCKHKTEPGCAVKKAIDDGILTEKRLKLYQRLK